MPKVDAIQAEGRVVEILSPSLYRVELPNGHRAYAHVTRRLKEKISALEVGQVVTLEMSPFDLSRGAICLKH